MRKLFVSFTALICHLKNGSVKQEDLETGLFYFSRARQHVFAPWLRTDDFAPETSNELLWFFRKEDRSFDGDAAAVCHRRIMTALMQAEADGRIIWREPGKPNSYGRLSELLVKNGFQAIPGNDGRSMNGSYCHPGVQDRIRETGGDLQVVL